MKYNRIWKKIAVFAGVLLLGLLGNGNGSRVEAAEQERIKTGIYADGVELSGLTKEEANQAVARYIDTLEQMQITFLAAGDQEVVTTAGDLGLTWSNPELIDEALSVGIAGNVIERYKIMKDLQHDNLIYDIELEFDVSAINDILVHQCANYDREAVNFSMEKVDGAFRFIEGQIGYKLDIEHSIDTVYGFLRTEWEKEPAMIALNVVVEQPLGSEEELAQVKDVLGTFTTSFTSSGTARTANVTNGCNLINGVMLYPGEEFSTYKTVAPFSEANGYYMAGSYLNGKVVDSIGGGICQVSTTLYNAALLAELEITERHNHSMVVSYVDPSADAAIAESAGKDFRFVNNTDAPIYIEGTIKNKHITFTIYGKETRPENRTVRYETEILETVNPPADQIFEDPAQPIGYFLNGDSAHIGYKARLWKVVTENGVEISREKVNSSSYKMTPRSATVGIATSDPNALNEIKAAIGTGSIDHVKNVIALLTSRPTSSDNTGEIIEYEAPAE